MIELINQILAKWGCMHQWKIHDEVNIFHSDKENRPYKVRQILMCTKCGKIKKIEL
jgi:Fe2+ or Zn2+ uptake regulation protein